MFSSDWIVILIYPLLLLVLLLLLLSQALISFPVLFSLPFFAQLETISLSNVKEQYPKKSLTILSVTIATTKILHVGVNTGLPS